MEKFVAVIVALVSVVSFIDGAVAPSGAVCQDSYDCMQGSCCRDSSGRIVSQHDGGFMHFPVGSGPSGTCSTSASTSLAQMGEMCDSNCQCDVGLACYRPMSGVCCPPEKCYNATWVQQQKDYWANCFSNPHCAIPP